MVNSEMRMEFGLLPLIVPHWEFFFNAFRIVSRPILKNTKEALAVSRLGKCAAGTAPIVEPHGAAVRLS